MKVAEAERDYAYLNYRRIQADLDYDIRVAYAQLRAAEERVDLARVNLRNAQELARTSGILVDVGRDPPLRKLRADSLLAQAEADVAGAEGELRIARQRLASLIGSSDPQLSAANMPFDAPPPPLAIIAPNIDVRLAEAEMDAANARVALAQTDAVPDVTVSGGTLALEGSAAIANTVAVTVSGGTLQVVDGETVGSIAGAGAIDVPRRTRSAGASVGGSGSRQPRISRGIPHAWHGGLDVHERKRTGAISVPPGEGAPAGD